MLPASEGRVRGGRLTDAHHRHFRWEGEDAEAMASFLLQHYAEGAFFPREILLPFPLPDRAALAAALGERAGVLDRRAEDALSAKIGPQDAQ